MRVLVIGPSNIGDALLVADVIHATRMAYPKAHLTLAVGERAKKIFAGDPRIQTLVNTDAFSGFLGRMRLLLQFYLFMPHVVVDLRHTLYPLLLKPWKLFQYAFNPPKQIVHMRDRHLWKLARQAPEVLKLVPKLDEESLYFAQSDIDQVDQLWMRWAIREEQPVVVICPGARSHLKRWKAEGFARVADALVRHWDAQIIFSGEPDEREVVESVRKSMSYHAHTAVGLITIRQLGVLMSRVDAVLTNDSASLHMASAVDVPTVAIFGPTDSQQYGPRASLSVTLQRRLFCAPCKQSLCHLSHECMRFISEEEVYTAMSALLEGTSEPVDE